jgi:rod shape-determining protein MreC
MLITDPTFAAGVVSQKNRVHGTLKGQGHSECLVDYVQNEEHVDIGEWFYTSGDDRIFPKGFPVGQVTAAPNGKTFKEIYVSPSGMQGGVEEVLIVLQGVHQEVPGAEVASPAYTILAAPAEPAAATAQTPEGAPQPVPQPGALLTDADRLRAIYKDAGIEQKHTYGEGTPGSKPPDFTKIPSIHGVPPPNAGGQPVGQTTTAKASPAPVRPNQVQPNQTKAISPKPPAPVVVKPKPGPSGAAAETDDEPAPGDAPAPRKPATPALLRPRTPASVPAAGASDNQ